MSGITKAELDELKRLAIAVYEAPKYTKSRSSCVAELADWLDARGGNHAFGLRLIDAASSAERDRERVAELEGENAQLKARPTFGTRECEACGKQTRVTTAGCDHCDLEDK